jgi:hypothetical protein
LGVIHIEHCVFCRHHHFRLSKLSVPDSKRMGVDPKAAKKGSGKLVSTPVHEFKL